MSSPIGREVLLIPNSGDQLEQPPIQEYPERRLLLLEDPQLEKYPAVFLEGLVDQARTVICSLFEGEIEELGHSDAIKEFSACMGRVQALTSSYPLPDYYRTMFLFQQWFHSSYRARQGKVLEHLIRYFLLKCSVEKSLKVSMALPKDKRIRYFFENEGLSSFATIQDITKQLYPDLGNNTKLGDVDAFALIEASNSTRAVAVQIRSRDDTGGATAKGSLVDFLKKLFGLGNSPKYEILYLIGVWDAQSSKQKNTTISKLLDALGLQGDQQKEVSEKLQHGKKYPIKDRVYLQLQYGIEAIQRSIEDWIVTDNSYTSSCTYNLTKLARDLECWDDFWLAYAVATIEIHNTKLIGKSNINKLLSLLQERKDDFCQPDDVNSQITEIAQSLMPDWDEPCYPFNIPRDVFLYIRDLLYLYCVYKKHCSDHHKTQEV
ncbi:MAG: hypothetical protein KatS3mg019_0772 [Fimbriimonadales bacterium]|nr:MAG: hypothetical protein KatS3mg019_0772 [Fimbriimonadales bacterium]